LRFNCLCICLLALLLGAGAADANGFSLQNSINMMGGGAAFEEEYVNSLFGIGTEASEPWFGPAFENTSSASSFLSEFFINTTLPMTGGFTPVKIDVSRQIPSKIYFGSGQEITYTQYQSTISSSPAKDNELWIQKGTDWSQYAIVPEKSGVQLVVFAPAGGQADYYEIYQSQSMGITSKSMNFYSGYSSITFSADKAGRHILLFVLNNQPSNAVIVDVISEAPPAQQAASANDMPPATNLAGAAGYGQGGAASGTAVMSGTSGTTITSSTTGPSGSTTVTQTQQIQGYGSSYSQPATQTPAPTSGDTPVTIQSQGMRGYQVFLDEVFIGGDGINGDPVDGKFSFRVVGGQSHSVRVFDGEHNYPNVINFPRGVQKIIRVEPGTTVYV